MSKIPSQVIYFFKDISDPYLDAELGCKNDRIQDIPSLVYYRP